MLSDYIPGDAPIKKPKSDIPRKLPSIPDGGLLDGGRVPGAPPMPAPGPKKGPGADDGGLRDGGVVPGPTPMPAPGIDQTGDRFDFYNQYKNYQDEAWNTARNMNTELPIGKVRSTAVAAAKGNKNDEQLKAELLAQGITPGSTVWNDAFDKLQRGESADVTGAVTGAEIQGATFRAQQEATKAGLMGNLATGFGNIGTGVAGMKSQELQQQRDLEMTDKWSKITHDDYLISLKEQQNLWTDENSPISKLLSYFGISGATGAKKTGPMKESLGISRPSFNTSF